MANTGLNLHDKDGRTSMAEILHLHDGSVVREAYENDVINSSQSILTIESIVPLSSILYFLKKTFMRQSLLLCHSEGYGKYSCFLAKNLYEV